MRIVGYALSALVVLLPAQAIADPLGSPNTFPLWRDNPPLHHHESEPTGEKLKASVCESAAQRPDERIEACRALIDANHRTQNTWNALGEAYLDKGDLAAAIDAFTHTINDDQIWLGRINRAIAYARSGNYEAALADADEFVKINRGGNAQSLALRCRVRAIADRDREAALKDCTDALDKEPHLANPLTDKVLLLFRLGRTVEALAACEDALKFGGHQPLVLYLRGTIRKQNGEAGGDADIATALEADSAVADQVVRYVPGRSKPQASDEEPPL